MHSLALALDDKIWEMIITCTHRGVPLSRSDHRVISESFESFGSLFEWVFIVYPDIK
jgi:hypothetical protein